MCAVKVMFLTDDNFLMKRFVSCLKKPIRLIVWDSSVDKINVAG
jgi:hypothetical protein